MYKRICTSIYHTITVTVTVDLFSTSPLGYMTSKLGQIFARNQVPEFIYIHKELMHIHTDTEPRFRTFTASSSVVILRFFIQNAFTISFHAFTISVL
jgi:hypothetical protein